MDISPEHKRIVQRILFSYLPNGTKVWVFGSRAKKATKKFSDLDLAIESRDKLSLSMLASLQHDFSESDLPYKVDIIDLRDVEDSFLSTIKHDMVLLFEKME